MLGPNNKHGNLKSVENVEILLLSLSTQFTVDGQYIPSLFIELEVRHDKTSYMLWLLNSFEYPQHMLWLRNEKINSSMES